MAAELDDKGRYEHIRAELKRGLARKKDADLRLVFEELLFISQATDEF